MDRIAVIYGGYFIYWNSIMITMAACSAVLLFWGLYLHRAGDPILPAVMIPPLLILSLVFARFLHWYSRFDSYSGFVSAMTDYSSGGYALLGVFAACLLSACVVRALKLCRNLPELLDCMCLSGGIGIAVGRLACFFNTADRGMAVSSTSLPWVYPVTNAASGLSEYRLAVFLFQAVFCAVLTITLLILWFRAQRRWPAGDAALIFLLCYSASQIVFDSMRYDSLYFRSNGFVSIVQVVCALTMLTVTVLFSVRMVRISRMQKWYFVIWTVIACLFGLAGYMEYYVQRHGDQALFAYSMMSLSLTGIIAAVLVIRMYALNMQRLQMLERRQNMICPERFAFRIEEVLPAPEAAADETQ